jgi:hypothetical protein
MNVAQSARVLVIRVKDKANSFLLSQLELPLCGPKRVTGPDRPGSNLSHTGYTSQLSRWRFENDFSRPAITDELPDRIIAEPGNKM